MQNPRLATRYAKSVLDLAIEKNSVEAVLADMQVIHKICLQSRDFEVMLHSPVINGDKKLSVINEVLKRFNINEITQAFVNLLVTKGRELNLHPIAIAFIEQYNVLKNIRTVKLTTAVPMNDAIRKNLESKIAGFMPNDTVDLKTAVDDNLIGGFVLEVEDKLFDASVRKHLNDVKSKIVDTSYVSKL